MPRSPRSPWTIPLEQGPVSKVMDRVVAAIVGGVAVVVVWRLAGVTADPRGHGTHEQLGMEPCGWPAVYGMPCPTCGCTTAATQLVHGDVIGAFVTQPFGAMVALIGVLAGAHAIQCLVRRRSFVDIMVRLPFWAIVAGMVMLLAAAWGYKCLVWEGAA